MQFYTLLVVATLAALVAATPDTMASVTLRNATLRQAVANDGSPQIFYFRRGSNATQWVLFLEGGFYCYDQKSCSERAASMPWMMSSTRRPPTVEGVGFTSSNCSENPLCNANMVYVAYLSSDVFIGDTAATADLPQFRGRRCLEEVVREVFDGFVAGDTTVRIPPNSQILFTGASAGGLGVILNAWRVIEQVHGFCASCHVNTLVDSGFFVGSVPNPLRNFSECAISSQQCAFHYVCQLGFAAWKSDELVNPVCASDMVQLGLPISTCLDGPTAVKYMPQTAFVLGFLFDVAEMAVDNLFGPSSEAGAVLMAIVDVKRKTLPLYPSFTPSCFGHMLSVNTELFSNATAGGVTLKTALNEWFLHGNMRAYADPCAFPRCRSQCPPSQ